MTVRGKPLPKHHLLEASFCQEKEGINNFLICLADNLISQLQKSILRLFINEVIWLKRCLERKCLGHPGRDAEQTQAQADDKRSGFQHIQGRERRFQRPVNTVSVAEAQNIPTPLQSGR